MPGPLEAVFSTVGKSTTYVPPNQPHLCTHGSYWSIRISHFVFCTRKSSSVELLHRSRRPCHVLKHHSFNDACPRATRWTPPGSVTGSQQNTERLMDENNEHHVESPLIQQTHSFFNLRIIQFLKGHFEIGQVFRGFIVSCRWNSRLFWWFFGRFSYWELRHGMRHDQVISWICF